MTCAAEGCGKPLKSLRPFCTDHIERMPYVQQVLAGLGDARSQHILGTCSTCGEDYEGPASKALVLRCPRCRINLSRKKGCGT